MCVNDELLEHCSGGLEVICAEPNMWSCLFNIRIK